VCRAASEGRLESLHHPSEQVAPAFGIGTSDLKHEVRSRIVDIAISSIALVFFSPVMFVIFCAIKLDSPGPVLFRQKRVGLDRRNSSKRPRIKDAHRPPSEGSASLVRTQPAFEDESSGPGPVGSSDLTEGEYLRAEDRRARDQFGKPIYLYKFRTMYVDSRERFPELYRYEYHESELDSVPIKVLVGHRRVEDDSRRFEHVDRPGNDPRVTRVGRWLRRTSLDELPNFISVLSGDMTLVGPRPDIVENVRWYQQEHLLKFRVKPGVTGLAQVSGRGNLSFHETNELDVEYVKSRSLIGDIRILLKTVWATLTRNGAF
jgi:lipopolysaccharide/colanic/teichoic acid biosynthesis glycosyltransferase